MNMSSENIRTVNGRMYFIAPSGNEYAIVRDFRNEAVFLIDEKQDVPVVVEYFCGNLDELISPCDCVESTLNHIKEYEERLTK